MNINNNIYNVDLDPINRLRYALYVYFYRDDNHINTLKEIINNNLPSSSIEYDHGTYTFCLKLKKNTIKKLNAHEGSYINLCSKLTSIFYEFYNLNRDQIRFSLNQTNDSIDTNNILGRIDNENYLLANLAHASWLSEDTLLLRL